ncbi:hypothetical protein [Enterocloster lavalensis]|uniref:hypothetical protein n=1 Tax=Enterocloster lavalensis TaxID=460384 RepID=UPI0014082942|nr:hypothetical protein [Enterocloster lavalensis]
MQPFNYFQKFLPYYSDRYLFTLCPKERIEDVVTFIDTYWKKNHAFVVSRTLLDWQYYNTKADCYNIAVAIQKETAEIHAMVGITCTSHFDPAITKPVRWGSLLKIRPDAEPGLGMMVEWYKNESTYACADVGLGESPTAIQLANKTGATTGVADQYYILHPTKRSFCLIDRAEGAPRHNPMAQISTKEFRSYSAEDFVNLEGAVLEAIPYFKSKIYYINRYFNHPIYHYHATGILGLTGSCDGVIFWRTCKARGAKCIRIIDYFGLKGALEGCLRNFNTLLQKWDAEYVDFLCVGMPAKELAQGGFVERHSVSGLIIPNYFEPFVQQNIDVTYSHMGASEAKVIFKGDSDQDRPNLLMQETI